MAIVFKKQSHKNSKGTWFAPGKCEVTGTYYVLKLCHNYAGHVRGGIASTWCYIAKGLTLAEAKATMEKMVGRKIYSDHCQE